MISAGFYQKRSIREASFTKFDLMLTLHNQKTDETDRRETETERQRNKDTDTEAKRLTVSHGETNVP